MWTSIGVIIYTYLGYPITVGLASRFFGKTVEKAPIFPSITVIIAAKNEETTIENKIINILESDYPVELIDIIVVSDGSTDQTNNIVKKYKRRNVNLINYPISMGKAFALNKGVAKANGDIIVFADARQQFDKYALKELVANFNDSTVGAVSGELHLISNEANSSSEGVGLYWKYEKFIRRSESLIHSSVGATGAIYAIRRKLYSLLPQYTILDDFIVPMRIVQQGYRVIFDAKAKAYDKIFNKSKQEFARKVRTLAGNFQSFAMIPELFNPVRTKVAFQLFSHKFLRLIVPYLVLLVFGINFFLLAKPIYMVTMLFQITFGVLAIMGLITENKKYSNKISRLCYTFILLNLAAIVGFIKFSTKSYSDVWKKAIEIS
ncbi:glycosyltransferase family 2 protein [candidate division KSB1 bacterium]|nr:glycosyltransferase family 2 protein [candidate division KSB1 bacterium]